MMSVQTIYRYLSILLFSAVLVCGTNRAYAQADSPDEDTVTVKPVKKKDMAGNQLSLGFDILRPVANYYVTDRHGYELQVDYYIRNEFYAVAEGGWGGATANYPDLKYTMTNTFYRLGFNKEILTRANPKDWDMMFFGMRAGFASIQRSPATFTIVDSLWGSLPSRTSGKNFNALWLELAGGMRVELAKGLFAGWTVRGKFIMNGKSFNDLSPLYIAGFGKGDKNTNFDMNVYISYAIRWKRKSAPVASPADKK